MIQLSAGIRKYDHTDCSRLSETISCRLSHVPIMLSPGSRTETWKFSSTYTPGKNKEAMIRIRAELMKGTSLSSSIFFRFGIPGYSPGCYLLLPACAYNGNRFPSRKIPYSPKLIDPADISPEGGIIISDVPRLDAEGRNSLLRDRAGAVSVPVLGVFNPLLKEALFICFPVYGPPGDNGIEFQESSNGRSAYLTLLSPVVREKTRYHICNNDFPSEDRGYDFPEGYCQESEFSMHRFPSRDLVEFFERFFFIRTQMPPDEPARERFPLSECYRTILSKFNRDNWTGGHGYYSVGMRENFLQDWQTGWTGGMISTFPLLQSGDRQTVERVRKNFNWFFSGGISPSGLFWESGEKGMHWYGGDIRREHTRNWNLSRKNADAIYWILRQFKWMKEHDMAVEAWWENTLKSVIDTFSGIWEREQQTGQFIDSLTGKIIVGGSTSAGILPAGLALASAYFNNSHYLDIACRIGVYFFSTYLEKGITCGGPGDALQCPDSESAFGLVESFVTLYETTLAAEWLDRARHAANYFSSWTMNYNYRFPADSTLGTLGVKTSGSVCANVQNKHGSPGICINSGSALLRLSLYTGDYRYAMMLRDIVRHIPQLLSHKDRPVGEIKQGWVTERVSTTDWFEGIGEIMTGSTWAETTLMLTHTELPGIYLLPAEDLIICFDNLVAEYTDPGKTSVTISNPSIYVAETSLMIDGTRIRDRKGIRKDVQLLLQPAETAKINIP